MASVFAFQPSASGPANHNRIPVLEGEILDILVKWRADGTRYSDGRGWDHAVVGSVHGGCVFWGVLGMKKCGWV